MNKIDVRGLFIRTDVMPFPEEKERYCLILTQEKTEFYLCNKCSDKFREEIIKKLEHHIEKKFGKSLPDNVTKCSLKFFQWNTPALCVHCSKLVSINFTNSYYERNVRERLMELFKITGTEDRIEMFKGFIEGNKTLFHLDKEEVDDLIQDYISELFREFFPPK